MLPELSVNLIGSKWKSDLEGVSDFESSTDADFCRSLLLSTSLELSTHLPYYTPSCPQLTSPHVGMICKSFHLILWRLATNSWPTVTKSTFPRAIQQRLDIWLIMSYDWYIVLVYTLINNRLIIDWIWMVPRSARCGNKASRVRRERNGEETPWPGSSGPW